jgi:hypothetical protein
MTFEVSRLFKPEALIEIEVVAAVPAVPAPRDAHGPE